MEPTPMKRSIDSAIMKLQTLVLTRVYPREHTTTWTLRFWVLMEETLCCCYSVSGAAGSSPTGWDHLSHLYSRPTEAERPGDHKQPRGTGIWPMHLDWSDWRRDGRDLETGWRHSTDNGGGCLNRIQKLGLCYDVWRRTTYSSKCIEWLWVWREISRDLWESGLLIP